MPVFTLLSPSEQVVIHLREEIFRGRWGEMIPGAPTLAKELEVDHKAVITALNLLEEEGLLVGQGAGRKRRIVQPVARAELLGARDLPRSTARAQERSPQQLEERAVVIETQTVGEARQAQPFAAEELVEEEVVEPARVAHHVDDGAAAL